MNTGHELLKRAAAAGLTIKVEDEPRTTSYVKAWRDVREYVGMADVYFFRDGERVDWAQIVHVNDPEETLSDYSLGGPIEPIAEEIFNEASAEEDARAR